MNKIAIIFFSGTGNTKYVASVMKSQLEKKDFQVDLINIERDKIHPQDYQYIILGGPVYIERFPENLIRYAEKNLTGYRKRCMLFSTQATSKPTAAFEHAKKRLNFLRITYSEYFTMPNNFYNFMFKKYTEDEEIAAINAIPEKTSTSLSKFLDGKKHGYMKKTLMVSMIDMVYKIFYPHCIGAMTRNIKIDKDRCISCGICEKRCPTGSFSLNRKARFGKGCLLCQRCMCSCPKDAFIKRDKYFDQYKLNKITDIK